jgi:capsular exopolysaccharide synthesis family protein
MKKAMQKNAELAHSVTQKRKNLLSESTAFSTTEEYKMLRASIAFAASAGTERCKIVGITSALPEEGKTMTCLNLAISFALTRANVLVVDCDLRKPSVSEYLSVLSAPGLSNVLAGMSTLGNVIHEVERTGESFNVIPSGDIPPNPSELLGSERMGAVLDELAKTYDYVFLDFPPLLLVSDALVLSRRLTGVAMVVRAGQAKRDDVRAALERLKLAQAHVLGFVLNRVQRPGGRRLYAPYEYGYGRQAAVRDG